MFAPAVADVMKTFHSTNDALSSFVVSAFVLGYFVGPLFLGPASELYGRSAIYHICNILFTVFCVGCALSNSLGLLIAFRFLAGTFGGCPITIGAGSLADMFSMEKRGTMIAVWALGPLVGPVIGPIAGGFDTPNDRIISIRPSANVTTRRWVSQPTRCVEVGVLAHRNCCKHTSHVFHKLEEY
jgi:MFS family permease